ncbi:MAG: CoA transferase, partial [Chloroflexota bacterium]
VVWINFRPQAIENIGVDYDTLKGINPRIVHCSLTGYGLSGPYRNRPSFDIGGLAISGVMSLTGEPGGPPLKPGPPMGDITTGMMGALGVCSALVQRERTGKGQLVDISLLDSCMATLVYEFAYYFCSGIVPQALGSGHLSLVPYNAYNTKEGWMVIGPSWPRLARVLGLDWMVDDPRFATLGARLEHKEEFDRIIGERLMEAPAKDWLALMDAEDIAAAPVNTLDEAAVHPQVQHRHMVLGLEHSLGGQMRLVGNPLKMPGSIDDTSYLAPPTLGQHDHEVFAGILGYAEGKIDKLLTEGRAHLAELDQHLHKRL